MCGHVGVAGVVNHKAEQAFKDLLVVDVIRGSHSTGIAAFSRGEGIRVVKHCLLPTDLFTMMASKELFRVNNQVLLGHNRWATKGAINAVNAHPFEMESLVGAHNGTLFNQNLLPDSKDFEVDSENLLHSIQKIGVAETYKLLHGAAALVWFKEDDYTLNFLRNKERPMFITYANDRNTLFWASEAWMLEGVLGKNGIDHTEIYDTAIDTHYHIRVPQIDDKGKGMQFDKMGAEVLTPFVLPKKNRTSGNVTRFPNGRKNTTTNFTPKMTSGMSTGSDYEIGEDVYFYLDPNCDRTQRYIDCIDSKKHTRVVRVYCHKSSYLREALDDVDDVLYMGTCNGYLASEEAMGVLCQGNSVYSIIEEDSEEEKEEIIDFTIEEFALIDREQQQAVLIKANHTCGICDSQAVRPHPRNFCLSDKDIICHECRGTSFAEELIKEY